MSPKTRALIRTVFAVPSAAVLVFGATQALASPPSVSRIPEDCEAYCADFEAYCTAYPFVYNCKYCKCSY